MVDIPRTSLVCQMLPHLRVGEQKQLRYSLGKGERDIPKDLGKEQTSETGLLQETKEKFKVSLITKRHGLCKLHKKLR